MGRVFGKVDLLTGTGASKMNLDDNRQAHVLSMVRGRPEAYVFFGGRALVCPLLATHCPHAPK